MCYFENVVVISEKETHTRPAAFLSFAYFCLRWKDIEPKVKFFAQKLFNLGPVLNKLMEIKRITGGGW